MNDRELLTYFDELQENSIEKQKLAANKLINSLLAESHNPIIQLKKQNFSSLFGNNVTEDVDYVLKRLIRGTTSQQAQISSSFASCLPSLLKKFDSILSDNYLKFVEQICDLQQTVKKSEEKYFILGKLFCFYALVISGRQISQNQFNLFWSISFSNQIQKNWYTIGDIFCFIIQEYIRKLKREEILMIMKKLNQFLHGEDIHSLALLLIMKLNLKEEDFPFLNLLEKNVVNIQKLINIISSYVQKEFPKSHLIINLTIEYFYRQHINDQNFNYNEFWIQLSNIIVKGESNYKNYFILLQFLNQFIKNKHFNIKSFYAIFNELLLQLWRKNIHVNNKFLKNISIKIQQNLIHKLQQKQIQQQLQQSQDILLNFAIKILAGKTHRSNSKDQLLQFIYLNFKEEELTKLYKHLKKQLQLHSNDVNLQKYYINELYVMAEITQKILPHKLFVNIICLIQNESISDRLSKQLSPEQQEILNISKMSDEFQGYFYSLLNISVKNTIVNSYRYVINYLQKELEQTKEIEDNKLSLFLILEKIVKSNQFSSKEDDFYHQVIQYFQQQHLQKRIEYSKFITEKLNEIRFEKVDNFHKKFALILLMTSILIQSIYFREECFDSLQDLQIIMNKLFNKKKIQKQKQNEPSQVHQKNIQILLDILISQLSKSHVFQRDIVKKCFTQFIDEFKEESIAYLVQTIVRDNKLYLEEIEQYEIS